jgi:hypothetical protein
MTCPELVNWKKTVAAAAEADRSVGSELYCAD